LEFEYCILEFAIYQGFMAAGLSYDEHVYLKSSNLHRPKPMHPFHTGNRTTETIFDRIYRSGRSFFTRTKGDFLGGQIVRKGSAFNF